MSKAFSAFKLKSIVFIRVVLGLLRRTGFSRVAESRVYSSCGVQGSHRRSFSCGAWALGL